MTRARMAFAMNAPALRSAAAPAAPWTPAAEATTKAWWHADDTTGSVATWTDRVGSLAPTAAAGLQPVSAATSFNAAYRGVTTDGVDDCLITTSFAALPAGASPSWMFGVVDQQSLVADATSRVVGAYGAQGEFQRNIQRAVVTSQNRARISTGTTLLTDTLVNFSGAHMVLAIFDAALMSGWIDGAAFSPASTAITLSTTATRLRLAAGVASTANAFLLGVLRHFVIGSGVPPQALIDKLFGWAAWDSGLVARLPVGHPYKSAAP